MSLGHGTSVIQSGQVFQYDMSNTKKSWKGAPTENLITNPIPTSTSGFAASGGIGTLLYTSSSVQWVRTSYEAWGAYMNISPIFNATLDTLSQYTISFEWRTENSAIADSAYSYNLVQGNGVSAAASAIILSNSTIQPSGWYLFKYTFTPANNGVGDAYNRVIMGPNGTNVSTFYIRNIQFEKLSFKSPFVNGNRSNTDALIDLTGNNTITASSLTYASDNTFSFNGSTNYVTAPSFFISSDPLVSINMWVKRTADFNGGGFWGLGGGSLNNGINGYTSVQNKIGWDLWGQTTFHTGQDYPLNQWVNVCWVKTAATFTTSTLKVYINGVEYPLSTTVRNGSSTVNISSGLTIGRLSDVVNLYYAPGVVGFTSVYNRALTSAEVTYNFNALRGRYGL